MKKLAFMLLIISLLACNKEKELCGTVVAIPPPYYFPDSTWYSVCILDKDSVQHWIHVDSATYTTLTDGMHFCKK